MSEWKECTIADLGIVVGGATPSTKDSANYNNGSIAWITPKDLSGYQGRYISHGERNITEKGLKSCSTQLIIQGALRQNPFEFENKNDFEILTKLQHYGLGIRGGCRFGFMERKREESK